jgi:hypothetical protein
MDNPYQSPAESCRPPNGSPFDASYQRRPGLVRHVRVVAILMIVQGVLEFLASLGIAGMAVFMSQAMSQMPQPETAPPVDPFWMITLIYGVMATAAMAAAVLHVVAGLRNYRFRGRILGIVALVAGMLTLFTCYCLPTATALGVYGLIVYLNGEVSDAFRMGDAGQSADQILATFRR